MAQPRPANMPLCASLVESPSTIGRKIFWPKFSRKSQVAWMPHSIHSGGSNLRRSYRAVKKGGSVVCYGFAGDNFGGLGRMIAGVMQMYFLNMWPDGKRVRLCAVPGEAKKDNVWYRETLGGLLKMLSAGTIRPVIGAKVPLIEASRAHRLVEQSSVVGKVVLLCSPGGS